MVEFAVQNPMRSAVLQSSPSSPRGRRFSAAIFGSRASERLARSQDWAIPSEETAREYADTMHPRREVEYQRGKYEKWPVCSTKTGHFCSDSFAESGAAIICLCCCCDSPKPDSDIDRYGLGYATYFRHMKALAGIFALVSVLYLPAIVLNSWGAGANTGTESLAVNSMSLGNIGDGSNVTRIWIPLTDCGGGPCGMSKRDAALAYGFMDALATLVFVLAYLFIRGAERRMAGEELLRSLAIEEYTVRVSPLFPDTSEDDLREHFERVTGHRVAEVVVAEDVADMMEVFKRRGKAIRKLQKLLEEVARLKAQGSSDSSVESAKSRATDAEGKVRELTTEARRIEPHGRVLEGFVSFESMDGARLALREYGKGSAARTLCLPRRLRLYPRAQRTAFTRSASGAYRSVRNLDVEVGGGGGGGVPKVGRLFCVCDCMDCACGECGNNEHVPAPLAIRVTRAPAPSSILWQNLAYDERDRTCRAAVTGFASLLLLALSFLLAILASIEQRRALDAGGSSECPTDEGGRRETISQQQAEDDPSLLHCYCQDLSLQQAAENKLCQNWASSQAQALGTAVAAAAAVPMINSMLTLVFQAFAKFEKHHSLEDRDASFGRRLLLATLANTAGVVLLVNAYVPALQLPGQHRDFSSAWYATVGASITITMILNIFTPHLYWCALWRYTETCRRSERAVENAKSQRKLNELFLGPYLKLPMRYAQAMNTVAVTLLYSAGIPLLAPIAMVYFLVHFWVDKTLALRFFRTPPKQDARLGGALFSLIPYFLVAHAAFAVWMLGNNEIFRSDKVGGVLDFASDSNDADVQSGATRAAQLHTFPLLALLALLVLLLILRFLVRGLFKAVSRCVSILFCGLCTATDEFDDAVTGAPKLEEARSRPEWSGRLTYKMLEDPDLQDLLGVSAEFTTHKSVRRLRDLVRAPLPDDQVPRTHSQQNLALHTPKSNIERPRSVAAPARHRSAYSQDQHAAPDTIPNPLAVLQAANLRPDGGYATITHADGSAVQAPTYSNPQGIRFAVYPAGDGSNQIIPIG